MLKEGIGGFCMALADSVPGVSGGIVAFIMGFYDRFIGSIHNLAFGRMKEKRSALRYLARSDTVDCEGGEGKPGGRGKGASLLPARWRSDGQGGNAVKIQIGKYNHKNGQRFQGKTRFFPAIAGENLVFSVLT